MGNGMFEAHLPEVGEVREAFCENCGQDTNFVYIGAQTYSAKVAEKLGIAPVVQQWRCEHCHTTVSVSEAEAV
jgi:hypothetical protein